MSRSTVRVEVTFETPVVFAGEPLSAIISFRNTAEPVSTASGTNSGPNSHQRQFSTIDSGLTRPKPQRKPVKSEDLSHTSNSPLEDDELAADGVNGSAIGVSESPEPDDSGENDAGWLSGRRLSMQVANTFREFYSSTGNVNAASQTSLSRTASSSVSRPSAIHSENLLMGFAQLQGYFQVDESLVDVQAFQHVRTQGVVVGKRGLEYGSGSNPGLFKGLTSGFVGNLFKDQQHPISETSGDIPIFTTPQSLLFVDLKLSAGESKSFSYQLKLPQSLPPSCRGKAVSIYYNLVIGTQKLAKGSPRPKIILVPFRVFPFIDDTGSQPLHTLTDPLVLRNDDAIITQVNDRRPSLKSFEVLQQKRSAHIVQDPATIKQAKDEFTSYVTSLLEKGPSSTDDSSRRRSSTQIPDKMFSVKDNIEYFVKFYQRAQSETPKHFKSNFDICRKGLRIAYINLSRPVYRIGEEVTLFFDFSKSDISCHHITASLETTENIDARVSLKSSPEVTSLTRRIFSHMAISSFSASKIHIQFTIPSTATPQFNTSDISLGWSIKLDFITGANSTPSQAKADIILVPVVPPKTNEPALTGTQFVARSVLPCESFSCRIPLQVYPTNQDIGALLDHHPSIRRWIL
jgi:hypothetical protein